MLRSIIYLKSKGFGATANWERPLHVFYRHAHCQHYHKLLRLVPSQSDLFRSIGGQGTSPGVILLVTATSASTWGSSTSNSIC